MSWSRSKSRLISPLCRLPAILFQTEGAVLCESLGWIPREGQQRTHPEFCSGRSFEWRSARARLRSPWKEFPREMGLDGVSLRNYTRLRGFKGAAMAELSVMNQSTQKPVAKERLPMTVQLAAGLP